MFTALYWLFCFSFAFDFRGEEGGSAVQYIFLAASLSSGTLMVLASPSALRSRPTLYISGIWWFYLGTTLVVALLSHVVLSQYVRCLLPPLLCGLALLVGQSLAARHYPAEDILRPLLWAGIASVIFRFVHAIFILHIPVDTVRWEMLSPAIPLLFAAATSNALLAQRMQPLPLIGGALALGSVLMSVTRSFILTLAVAALTVSVAFVASLKAGWWSAEDIRRKLNHLAICVLLVLFTFVALYFVQPTAFDRWTSRLFHDGGGRTKEEVTYLTREAEAKTMWHLLEADPIRFVYGKGLGADYHWDTSYYPELLQVYPNSTYVASTLWLPGHSVWTYALFAGGFFAVACYGIFFCWLMMMGFAGGRMALRYRVSSPDLGFLPFVVGVCYFSQTLTANPFGERFAPQILGLCAALPQVFWLRASQARQAAGNGLFSHAPHPPLHARTTPYRAG